MRSKQNIPFPWDEFNRQRLYITFESYEDFEDFVTFLAKKRNHYWAKQKAEGLRELWNHLSNLCNFAITSNAVKPCSIINKQIVPYGRYFYTYREMLMAKILVRSGYDHFDKLKQKLSGVDHVWGRLIKDKPAYEEVIFPIDVMEGVFKDNAPSIINFHSLVEYLNERDGVPMPQKKTPVLDEVEKEWLKHFASLFKNAIFVTVTKHTEKALNGSEDGEFSYLTIAYDENGERRGLILPSFKTADMYKGMVNGHVYDFDKLMENKG